MQRLVSVAVALAIFAAVFSFEASAFASAQNISDKYRTSKYYKNMTDIELGSDEPTNVLMIAMSQLGYHEGNGSSELDGMNQSGSGNYVEYNYLYGMVDGDGNGTPEYGYAWCASFVSWCLRQAGVPTSTVKSYVSCTNWVAWFKQNSTYKARSSGYTPEPGDIIFFKSAYVTRTSDHVGLVLYVKNGTVYTIEGNSGERVSLRNYKLNDGYIVGYGIPSYNKNSKVGTDFSKQCKGTYIINAASLNVRSSPSTSNGSILGRLSLGDTVEIDTINQGWGRITYNGKVGWISMSYAYLVAEDKTRTAVFSDKNGLTVASTIDFKSEDPLTLPDPTVEVQGYSFDGWALSPNAASAEHKAGDTVYLTESTTFYAVWKPLTYTIAFCDYNGKLIEERQYTHFELIEQPSELPARQSDEKYIYTFKGWDHICTVATGNDTFYAVYDAIDIKYPSEEQTVKPDSDTYASPALPTETDTDTDADTAAIHRAGCAEAVEGAFVILFSVMLFAVVLIKKGDRL